MDEFVFSSSSSCSQILVSFQMVTLKVHALFLLSSGDYRALM